MSEQKTVCPLCHQVETEEVKGDLPCIKCQEDMKKGFLLIGVDLANSDTVETAVRTGHRWIVGLDAAKVLYNAQSIAKRAGLIDIDEARAYGLPITNQAR